MKPQTKDTLHLIAGALALLAVGVSILLAVAIWNPQGLTKWLFLGVLVLLALRRRLTRLAGAAFVRMRPEQVASWRARGPLKAQWHAPFSTVTQSDFTDTEIAAFCLARVSYDEAARIGVTNLADYRYARLVERRTGLRFGADGLRRVDVDDLRAYINACQPRRSRWLPSAVRRIRVDRLRVLAVLTASATAAGVPMAHALRKVGVDDRVLRQIRSADTPAEVLGWVLAMQAAIDDGTVEAPRPSIGSYAPWVDPLAKVQTLYLVHQRALEGAPVWLLPLAGISPDEQVPSDVTVDSLRTLAGLRGHSLHLLNLAAEEPAVRSGVAA